MAVIRERILARLSITRIPPGLCWGKPAAFIELLTKVLTVTLLVNNNNEFVVIGHATPSEDDKRLLWIRRARNGSFQGYYLFVQGKWQRIHNYRNDEIIWMYGDSRDIPDGFILIDGATPTIPIDVQAHIITQYKVNTAIMSASPVYEYFAVQYVGI